MNCNNCRLREGCIRYEFGRKGNEKKEQESCGLWKHLDGPHRDFRDDHDPGDEHEPKEARDE